MPKLTQRLAKISSRGFRAINNLIELNLNTENFIVANQTPFEILHQADLLTVRYYPPLPETPTKFPIPVLLIPPLAADPMNFDLMPERSLVRFLLARGYAVYLADFGSPNQATAHLGLADYATRFIPEAIQAMQDHNIIFHKNNIEKKYSLLGYCMGGLFALTTAAWQKDENLKNIITIASPIDAHQAGMAGKLWQNMQLPARLVRKLTSFRLHNVNPEKLAIPGWVSSVLFKLTNPIGTVQSYFDLLLNLWDREYLIEHQTMSVWFNQMHDYPGGIVQDFFVRVGLDNAFAKGEIRMGKNGETKVSLRNIHANLLAIAGKTDQIVSVEAARKIMDIVPSADKNFEIAPGGHAGVFAGSRAPETTWTYIVEWLAERSG